MARVSNKRKDESERSMNHKTHKKSETAEQQRKDMKPSGKGKGKKNEEGSKITFTRENINSHLVSYNEDPGRYKIMGMLTYLFKEFDNTPAELLSKLKVITTYKKIKLSGDNTPELILKHLFAILGMKDSFNRNLLNLLRNNTFLSAMAVELYFSTPMENEEQVKARLSEIFDELTNILEDKGAIGFKAYLEEVQGLENCDDLESKVKELHREEEIGNVDVEKELVVDKQPCETIVGLPDEGSDFSLLSLNDDEQIARLDSELGKHLRGNLYNPGDDVYGLQLLDCVEKLLKANFIYDISFLYSLFYLYQFLPFSAQVRVLIRIFMEKFSDRGLVFRMYQLSSVVIPSLYELFSVFKSYCAEEFDESVFIKV
ncbi:hypothetical protein PAEPH01_2643, partial [Pancytospora epiphaga]